MSNGRTKPTKQESAEARHADGLAEYSDALADLVASRTARHLRNAAKLPAGERWAKALLTPASLKKLREELPPDAASALAAIRRWPPGRLRWDHAVRLVGAMGANFPAAVLRGLLDDGLVLMARRTPDAPLARFELGDGTPAAAFPFVRIAPPLAELPRADFPLPVSAPAAAEASGPWRAADGWEFPLRLMQLWRLARKTPIKRTQNQALFKRDIDRVANGPLFLAPPIDAPAPLANGGLLTHGLAMGIGMLDPAADEQRPAATLDEVWPVELPDLLALIARGWLDLDLWNELGDDAPAGSFSRDMPSARRMLLLLLDGLPDDAGTTVEALAACLKAGHPPFSGGGEMIGVLKQAEGRARLAREWTAAAVLGPMFQLGLVEAAPGAGADEHLVRLSPLGRAFVAGAPLPPPGEPPAQTLLVQPNHQLIVYRQGLTLPLLSRLALIGEPTGFGPALTWEINAESVYLGLEAGLPAEEMQKLLERHGGREVPASVAQALKTWSGKRERFAVHGNATIFEFDSADDLEEALRRGSEGIRLNDRLLLIPGDPSFGNLRITAQRDYLRAASEPCVAAEGDGCSMKVDFSRSDLMLESELARFAVPAGDLYRITPETLRKAAEQGFDAETLANWFVRRTGAPPPAGVALLLQILAGARAALSDWLVIETPDAALADGLLAHSATAGFSWKRLGPEALALPPGELEAFRAACAELGMALA